MYFYLFILGINRCISAFLFLENDSSSCDEHVCTGLFSVNISFFYVCEHGIMPVRTNSCVYGIFLPDMDLLILHPHKGLLGLRLN